jgi:hypothetical protein
LGHQQEEDRQHVAQLKQLKKQKRKNAKKQPIRDAISFAPTWGPAGRFNFYSR